MEFGTSSSVIRYEEEFITNSRGMKLFTCQWKPAAPSEVKGLIFFYHGYSRECSISMEGFAILLAKEGYAVYGMDYEGHGKSSGLKGYIPNFDDLVNDCSQHFTTICEKAENNKRKRILMGESMGGAVVLLLHMKKPDYWDMAVLLAPMCKIANEQMPLYPVLSSMVNMLAHINPTWKVPLIRDLIDASVRVPELRNEARSNPLVYNGWMHLGTLNEVCKVSLDLGRRFEEVSLPFLLIHGGNDKVTDPSASKLLYESASSSDKIFKFYQNMWHLLTYGELPENINIVFSDIITWLDQRVLK